jgi:hypothetical protein
MRAGSIELAATAGFDFLAGPGGASLVVLRTTEL